MQNLLNAYLSAISVPKTELDHSNNRPNFQTVKKLTVDHEFEGTITGRFPPSRELQKLLKSVVNRKNSKFTI
jgi:hypothetical protein